MAAKVKVKRRRANRTPQSRTFVTQRPGPRGPIDFRRDGANVSHVPVNRTFIVSRRPESTFRQGLYSGNADSLLRARNAPKAGQSGSQDPYAYDIKTSGPSGVDFGIVGNFGRDLLDTVTGVPSAIQLAGHNFLAWQPLNLAGAGLSKAGVPGLGWTQDLMSSAAERDKMAGRAIAQDYNTRWGPLFRGDVDEWARQTKLHPGLFALDVAAAWSGAGAGVRAGALAATGGRGLAAGSRLARLAETSILPEGAATSGGRISTGARYREPLVREVKTGPNVELGGDAPATMRVEVKRRPYSKNPLTRAVQKRLEPHTRGFSDYLERTGNLARAGEKGGVAHLARPFGTMARYNRVAARQARDLRFHTELERARRLRAGTREYLAATRDLVKEYGDAGEAALRAHLQDLLDVPGVAPSAARQAIADFMFSGLDKAFKEHGVKTKGANRTINAVENIPDELLRLDAAPEVMQRAYAAAREVSEAATAMRVEAGTLSAETASAIGSRAAEQVHGGSRWDPKLVRETDRVVSARAALEAALAARKLRGGMTPTVAIRRAFTAGKRTGRGERNVEIAAPLGGTRWTPRIPSPEDITTAAARHRAGSPKVQVVRGGASAAEARGPGISAAQARGYAQAMAGRGRAYGVRVKLKESRALNARVKEARHEVRVAEREARGGWTQPSRTDVGRRGVYVPDRPADRLNYRGGGDPRGAFGRMTTDKVHESHGTLFGMGNVNLDHRVLVQALDRALVDAMHPGFVRQMVDTFAAKVPDAHGNPMLATGDRAIEAMRTDPENIVLSSRKSLEDAMRLARDEPIGSMPDDPLRGAPIFEGENGVTLAEASGIPKGDVIAVPKAAIEAVRQGYGTGKSPGLMAIYDTPLQLWRRGILAFAPRWYLNNLFGNTFQYGLLTGGDFKAIRQARRPEFANAVPERVMESTLVEDARMADPAAPVGAARAKFEQLSDKGMDFNHRLESIIRRAAYISTAKKALRREGVNVRKLSDEDLARAIEEMPTELVDDTIREVELFMGDYVRMQPWERATLKRIFPFYSWMRVIGKFMGVVPFRHPKRTALMAAVAGASADAVNPDDFMMPLYDRGRVNIGDYAWRTASANPLATHAELATAIASRNPVSIAGSIARDVTPIGGQQAVQMLTGRNTFGRPFTAPPGWGDSAQAFGGYPQAINPATGLPEESLPHPGLGEMLFQTVPIASTLIRGIAAGGRTPYDTASTLDLLTRSKPDWQLFNDSPNARGMTGVSVSLGGYDLPLSPVLSTTGLNFQRRDREAEYARYQRNMQRYADAQRQTQRRILKVSGGGQ